MSRKQRFSQIYTEHHWGSGSRSGPGSEPHRLDSYLTMLRDVLDQNGIRSVVDLGCGDWAFSQAVDWSGIQYTGVDVVPELVAKLQAEHQRDGVRFLCADLVEDELPAADLCICKDVLQHLSNRAVREFLDGNLRRYRHAVLTNDRTMEQIEIRGGQRMLTAIAAPNSEIADGEVRPLRLAEPPFSLDVQPLDRIEMEVDSILFTKEVLLWSAPGSETSVD